MYLFVKIMHCKFTIYKISYLLLNSKLLFIFFIMYAKKLPILSIKQTKICLTHSKKSYKYCYKKRCCYQKTTSFHYYNYDLCFLFYILISHLVKYCV